MLTSVIQCHSLGHIHQNYLQKAPRVPFLVMKAIRDSELAFCSCSARIPSCAEHSCQKALNTLAYLQQIGTTMGTTMKQGKPYKHPWKSCL